MQKCRCRRHALTGPIADVHKLLHIQAFSPREFVNTIVMQDRPVTQDGRRSCIVISLPREGAVKDKAHALGVYVSVETVRELGDGKVEIVMASTVSLPMLNGLSVANRDRVMLEGAFRGLSRTLPLPASSGAMAKSSSSTCGHTLRYEAG